jgi:tol-pal system protein YbgF
MRVLIVPAMALSLAGCVSSGDIELLHKEITDVSRQVENLGRVSSGKEDLQVMSRRLAEQGGQMLKSNADIQLELKALRDQIQNLQSNLDVTNQRLAATSNELAATRDRLGAPATPSTTTPPAGGTGAPGPQPAQLFNSAYEDYLRGNFDMAIQGFQDYAKRYPTTEQSDQALYWIGECHYSKKQYKEAIDTFTQLLNSYKTSDKAAAALLKKGFAFQELGDKAQAVINFQYVIYEHPGSKEAELAKDRLNALGVRVR